MLQNEPNHFLRGERNLTLTDVMLAKFYGPILKNIAKSGQSKSYKQFLIIAKKEYSSNPVVQEAIHVTTGRRFEAFRLYLRQYNLPDLSAWVTDQKDSISLQYTKDFDPLSERSNTINYNWDLYIPDPQKALPTYDEFFRQLDKYGRLPYRKRTCSLLEQHLEKLKIKNYVRMNFHLLPDAAKKDYKAFMKPYAARLIFDLCKGDDLETAFRRHVPGFPQGSA
jgi:hypothetical protein